MIKKYMHTLFALSLSLLISPIWAGKVFFKDGRELEVPDSVVVRNNVYELGAVALGLANKDPFDVKFNMAVGEQVNKDQNAQEPIGKLMVSVNKDKYTLTYPTYAYIAPKDRSCFFVEYKEFWYKLSDIMENKLDENGFTVQDK